MREIKKDYIGIVNSFNDVFSEIKTGDELGIETYTSSANRKLIIKPDGNLIIHDEGKATIETGDSDRNSEYTVTIHDHDASGNDDARIITKVVYPKSYVNRLFPSVIVITVMNKKFLTLKGHSETPTIISLCIQQYGSYFNIDQTPPGYSLSVGKDTGYTVDELIGIIEEFVDGASGYSETKEAMKAFKNTIPSLREKISELFKFWESFDMNEAYSEREELLNKTVGVAQRTTLESDMNFIRGMK